MNSFLVLLIVIATFALLAWLCRVRTVFIVKIQSEVVTVKKGTVRSPFLEFLKELARDFPTASGTVTGVPQRQRIHLVFSRSLDAPFQQRARNWWMESGWILPR